MTIKEALNQAVIMLKNENIEAPKNKARMLLQTTLKKPKEYLMIYDTKEITPNEREQYIKNVKRLISGEPLQYITGKQEFMKLNFLVTKDVLIPRQDTEILVEEVINIANNFKNPVILDLCTGSGAIAISIAKYVKNVKVYASDEKFDIIVSNPPYIETDIIKTLSKDVQNEPKLALDGGKDGLDFYKKISENAYKFLNRQGYLCFEIGYNQKQSVFKILENQKRYINIYCKKDLCGNDRVIVARIG